MRSTLVMAIAACLAGCAVGPDYETPHVDIPAQFANAAATGFTESDVQAAFWRLFNEPVLDDLVEAALDANKDLEQARANLLASRAVRRIVGFDSYPTITAGASALRVLRSDAQLPGFTRTEREVEVADAGFDAVWELDFFGRVRRSREAARADEQAAAAEVRNAEVIVTGEVARNYFVLRGLQEQLDVATRNAENQRQTLELTQVRLDAGRGTELDRSRAEAQLKTTLASIPPLRASIATTIYRLSVLTGRLPDTLSATLLKPQPLPSLPQLNAIGNPDALLRRRPDIRSAERNLAAATARIGIAVGDLFPRVTFFGSVGYNATRLGDLGNSATDTYSYGPSISWAAFDLGRVRARVDVAKAQTQATLAAYEATVLAALEETDGALVTYGHAQSRRATLEEAAAASSKAASLARQRFEGGLANFLDVLDAERDALSAQDSLAQSRTQTATSLIAVYKALGGGWTGE